MWSPVIFNTFLIVTTLILMQVITSKNPLHMEMHPIYRLGEEIFLQHESSFESIFETFISGCASQEVRRIALVFS